LDTHTHTHTHDLIMSTHRSSSCRRQYRPE
jgi:hypothetical protein